MYGQKSIIIITKVEGEVRNMTFLHDLKNNGFKVALYNWMLLKVMKFGGAKSFSIHYWRPDRHNLAKTRSIRLLPLTKKVL